MTSGIIRAAKGRFHTKDSTRKSMLQILSGFHNNRERYNWMWNAANKSAMMTKKPPRDKEGKTIKKYNTAGNLIVKRARMSRAHGYKVLLSGASAEAYRIMAGEAHTLRRNAQSESAYCPAMPSISDGALLNLEQICVAICQTYFGRAMGLKNGMPLTDKEKQRNVNKKVTAKMQQLACATVNERIFGATGLGPGVVRMAAVPKKTKLRGGKKDSRKQRSKELRLAEPTQEKDGGGGQDEEPAFADA